MSKQKAIGLLAHQRRAMYHFGAYNPYQYAEKEVPLVLENLARYRRGEICLESFLKMTPHFPRWRDEHIRQARVLLVTNEPGLSNVGRLFAATSEAQAASDVANQTHGAMLSWLSLSNHPGLGAINGELPWREGGTWETQYPALAHCGKAGYLMSPGEEQEFSCYKVLHLELSPFPQKDGLDVNPRNDQSLEYHEENLDTVRKFCQQATEKAPRYLFIIGNRARILRLASTGYRLDAGQTPLKDKSRKIMDLLRVAESGGKHVHVRLCRHWPTHGRDVEVLGVAATAAYDLRAFGTVG